MFSRQPICSALIILFSLFVFPIVFAQDGGTLWNLPYQLKGKPVTMHRFYREVDQTYDENGAPTFRGTECPWTVCGRMLIKDVRIHSDYLELRGTRLFVGFGPDGQKDYDSKRNVNVRIALKRTPDLQSEAVRAFKTVFIHENEDISAFVPPIWQQCLKQEFCSASLNGKTPFSEQMRDSFRNRKAKDSNEGIFVVGNGVTPPKALATPDPEFTQEARETRVQGSVTLGAVVGTDGKLRQIEIERALGMGLDEAAIQKLSEEWRFKPGEKDGVPVQVRIVIETNFFRF